MALNWTRLRHVTSNGKSWLAALFAVAALSAIPLVVLPGPAHPAVSLAVTSAAYVSIFLITATLSGVIGRNQWILLRSVIFMRGSGHV